jgi:hypothetical protein
MTPRPFAAALLIALVGPAIGALPMFALFASWGPTPDAEPGHALLDALLSAVVGSYALCAPPAIPLAILAGYWIGRFGWIGRWSWTGFAALCGLAAPVLPYLINREAVLMAPSVFALSLVATLFAAAVLRIMIIRWGWMRKRPHPIWEVF